MPRYWKVSGAGIWSAALNRSYSRDATEVVLATVPVLDPAGNIGLRGNGLTPSKIDDFLSEPSL